MKFLKSLKKYLEIFRNKSKFFENIKNKMKFFRKGIANCTLKTLRPFYLFK